MGEGQPLTVRQITGDDIIAEVLRNAEQGVFKIRYTALLPSIYHVYLHPSDYDTIKPVLTALAAETRAALIERIDQLNRETKPNALARTLGFDSGKRVEYKILRPRLDGRVPCRRRRQTRQGRSRDLFRTRFGSAPGFRRRRNDTSRHETVSFWGTILAPSPHI